VGRFVAVEPQRSWHRGYTSDRIRFAHFRRPALGVWRPPHALDWV